MLSDASFCTTDMIKIKLIYLDSNHINGKLHLHNLDIRLRLFRLLDNYVPL